MVPHRSTKRPNVNAFLNKNWSTENNIPSSNYDYYNKRPSNNLEINTTRNSSSLLYPTKDFFIRGQTDLLCYFLVKIKRFFPCKVCQLFWLFASDRQFNNSVFYFNLISSGSYKPCAFQLEQQRTNSNWLLLVASVFYIVLVTYWCYLWFMTCYWRVYRYRRGFIVWMEQCKSKKSIFHASHEAYWDAEECDAVSRLNIKIGRKKRTESAIHSEYNSDFFSMQWYLLEICFFCLFIQPSFSFLSLINWILSRAFSFLSPSHFISTTRISIHYKHDDSALYIGRLSQGNWSEMRFREIILSLSLQ